MKNTYDKRKLAHYGDFNRQVCMPDSFDLMEDYDSPRTYTAIETTYGQRPNHKVRVRVDHHATGTGTTGTGDTVVRRENERKGRETMARLFVECKQNETGAFAVERCGCPENPVAYLRPANTGRGIREIDDAYTDILPEHVADVRERGGHVPFKQVATEQPFPGLVLPDVYYARARITVDVFTLS